MAKDDPEAQYSGDLSNKTTNGTYADAGAAAIKLDSANSGSPRNWSQSRKYFVTMITVSTTFLIGLNATGETSAAESINERFSISDASFPNSYLPVTSWNIGAAVAPLVLMPLMETFGLRYIYLVSDLASWNVSQCLRKDRHAMQHSYYSLYHKRLRSISPR